MCDVLKNKQVWRKQARGKASRSSRGNAAPLSPHTPTSSTSMQEESIATSTDMSNPQSCSSSGVSPHDRDHDGVGRHVQFGNCVRVLLIPSRHEYIAAGLAALMWWEDKEYSAFKQQAFHELIDYIDCHPGMDAKEAFRCMYRSTLEYEGEDITVSAVESLNSLSTISCSPSEYSEIQDKCNGDMWDVVEESGVATNDVEESNLTTAAVDVIGELAIDAFDSSELAVNAIDSGGGEDLNVVVPRNADCNSHCDIFGNSDSTDNEPAGDDALFSTASVTAEVSQLSTEAVGGQEVHSSRQKKSGRDGYLRSLLSESTIWYDLELMRLQTQRIVLLRTGGSGSDNAAAAISIIGEDPLYNSTDDAMTGIARDIEERSQKGPDFVLVSRVLIAAILYIFVVTAMVNCSTVMREEARLPALWSAAFVINVIAVSVPGRLDRMYSDGSHIKPWQSLFEPSPWAFAIWGVIYLTELLVTVYLCVFYKSVSSEFGAQGFQSALPYWTAGNCLQALWCFVFRPEFKSRLWIPSCCLFLSSLSLLGAYMQLPSSAGAGGVIFMLAKLSLALNASWLFCLTMITLNSWLTLTGIFQRIGGLATVVALSSSLAAMLGGALLSMYSSDISFALTCAWALDALASRSMDKSKLIYKSHSDIDLPHAELLLALSTIETVMSTFLKFVSVYITITVQVLGAIAPIHQ